jgi:folate-binding protein YgfZ
METSIQTPRSVEKSELDAVLTGAAFHPITDRAFIRITGSDATRWLNGMVTNSIGSLAPGEGNYNFLLSVQGRIQGECVIYREPASSDPVFLLETSTGQIETIQKLLDKFIIMDDVELSREVSFTEDGSAKTSNLLGVAILGLKADDALASTVMTANEFPMTEPPVPGSVVPSTHDGRHRSWVIAPPGWALPYFEVWCSDPEDYAKVLGWLKGAGVTEVSVETQEAFRILSGVPLYGVDIRDRELPQETGQTRALHFAKGCYLGQEIVERIRSRGNVHRTFGGFELTGTLPEVGVALEAEGKAVGELTSVAAIPLPGRAEPVQLALGYVRREALDRGLTLEYAGGTAKPVALPYAIS